MEQNDVMNAIHEEANKFGFGISVEQQIGKIYWNLKARGFEVCVLNERYLICNGCNYQLLKTRSKGVVTEYKHYRCRHRNTKCEYKRTMTELQLERELLAKLPELANNEIASIELQAKKQQSKPKYNIKTLRERLRTLNDSYMAGNKTDEEYISEGAEIKRLIAAAEEEVPAVERDLTPLKELLNADFVTIYSSLNQEEKRTFWRNIIEEIILDDNRISNVVFKY